MATRRPQSRKVKVLVVGGGEGRVGVVVVVPRSFKISWKFQQYINVNPICTLKLECLSTRRQNGSSLLDYKIRPPLFLAPVHLGYLVYVWTWERSSLWTFHRIWTQPHHKENKKIVLVFLYYCPSDHKEEIMYFIPSQRSRPDYRT
jgi:hypothetical protein